MHNVILVNNRREIIKRQKTGIKTEVSIRNSKDFLGKAYKILLLKDIRQIIKRQKSSV